MIRGIFTSASGMISEQRRLDVIGSNVSNINTAGYKSDTLELKAFDQELTSRMGEGAAVGTTTIGTTPYARYTDLSQGTYQQTNLDTDLAVNGDGFFAVQDTSGTVKYTRDGSFVVDAQGCLSLNSGERLLGANGQPLYVGTDRFTVSPSGAVTVGGNAAGQIDLYASAAAGGVAKRDDGFFDLTGPQRAGGTLRQGWVEGSNVDLVTSVTEMMSATRSFQANQSAYKSTEETLDKLVNLVGTLR